MRLWQTGHGDCWLACCYGCARHTGESPRWSFLVPPLEIERQGVRAARSGSGAMSLINDMLRDLDGYTEASSDKQSLQIDLTPEKKKTSVAKRLWLPALAIVTVLYAVIFEWNGLGLFPEQKTTPVEIPAPIALNSKWLNVPAENPASPSREGKVVLASVEEKSP